MKLDIKQRIENRREKDERAQMQREEHYCLELERQRKMILEEERRRAEALLAFENQRMLTEETEMRKFLENERKEAIRRQQEQEERERKEKELLAKRLREEQEKAEAEAKALAERQRKEREQEQMRRENEIREEQLKLEQAQREKKEKELKDRERQQKKEKEKIKATTKDRIVTGSLTARKGGVSGWGGAIEEPTMSSLEEESKNPLNEVINRQDSLSTDAAISDKSSPTSGNSTIVNPPIRDISSSSTDSDTVGPIVSLPLCDDTSVLNRITSFVQLGITSAKEPMKYQSSPTDGSPSDSNQLQENLSSLQSIDSILKNSLVTWKHWKQHHLMTPSSQTLPPPHHDTPRAHSHRQSHQQQPQQSQQQQTPHLSATTELKMSVENLQNLQFLKDYPSLISLECNVNQLTSLSDMSQYSCSTSLTDLSLNDNQLTSLHGLESYHSLQSLHCDVNQLIDLSPLQHLSHLLTLSIKMNRLETFPSLHLPSLQKLDLYHNRITSLTSSLTSSTSLQSLPSLTHLDLGRNKLTTLDGHLLSHCQLLSHLILSQNQLSHLPTPLYLPNLRSLWLSKNSICSLDSWIGHDPLPTPSHTLSSSPSSSSSSSSPSSSFPWPVFLPLLEKLYLQDNEIKTIPKYSFVTSPLLNELDLSFNNLSEVTSTDGILCCCPQLKRLQLQENPLLSRPNQQTLIIITRIQNSFPHLKEFCGHPVDAKKGVYAPPPSALVSSIALPLTTTEIAKEKQLRTKQRCEVIRNLKRNCWKGNVSEIFRFSSSPHTSPATSSAVASSVSVSASASASSVSAGVDLLELEPIQSHHPCSCVSPDYQRWSHFLSSLVAEQNIFKIREKLSSSSSSHPPHQLLGISSFVELLRSHCQLIHNWQQQQQQDLFTSFPPRVVFVSPSFPLSLSLPAPISAAAVASVSVSRKENTKEYHAVIRARQTHAVLAIQSLWRGHFTRKRLTHLLSHAKYYDADLEHLMDAHNLTDYLGILTEALPELSDDWLSHKQLGHSSSHSSANDNGGDSNTATLVYGDHRRKKMNYSPRSESSSFHPHPHHTPITPPERSPRAHRPTPRNPSEAPGGRGRGSHGEWVVDEKKTEILEESGVYLHRRTSVSRNADPKIHSHLRGEEEWDRDSEELGHQLFPSLNTHPRPSSSASASASASSEISRPASSSSTISGYRDHSSTPHSATSTSSQRFGKGEYHGDNEDIEMLLHTGRTRVSTTSSSFSATGAGAGAPDHWGVSSRPAVHNVLKRSKLSKYVPYHLPPPLLLSVSLTFV
jgi:Leucine-rich repeat (LRR) protein